MPKKQIAKVQVGKNDEAALIVERVIDTDAEEIVLSVPRFSRVVEVSSNFHLIKREAELLKKKIVIESVDDRVVELATKAGLPALNPLLIKSPRQFSDIVTVKKTRTSERHDVFEAPPAETLKAESRTEAAVREIPVKPRASRESRSRRFSFKGVIIAVFFVLLLSGGAIFAVKFLPRVDVKIVMTKTAWEFADEITLKQADGLTQTFSDTKTLSLSFPATGIDKISRYAKGVITIYNAYSSEAQPLVARTRFEAPDGKIFRLVKAITVPPAAVVGGSIVPSSIDAEVQADKPGVDYNIGPVEKFTIPGFKDSPRYQKFYGESKQSMAGGLVGEAPVATDSDIRKAKDDSRLKADEALTAAIVATMPNDFKIVDGATEFVVLKQTVSDDLDSANNFSVTTDARMSVVVFREADIVDMMREKMRAELGQTYDFKDSTITYERARADMKTGNIILPIKVAAVALQPIDAEVLRQRILGQTEDDLRVLLSSLPGVGEGSSVSFWPFWVKKVPERVSRVKIDIL